MGIVSRLVRPKGMSPDELEQTIRHYLGGGSTSAGVAVSESTAMRQSTVYSCVNVLSRSLAQIPCHLYKQEGRTREKATDHSLYDILHDQPNEWMTSPEFWGMAMASLALRGRFYGLKVHDRSTGRVREIIPLPVDRVQCVEQLPDYRLRYLIVLPDDTTRYVYGKDMFHLRGLTLDGVDGISPIGYIRETIGLGVAAEEFGARYFGQGTHPGVIVEHPGKLSEAASKNLRESLAESYSGLGKSHRLMLLEEGMKAQKITIDPRDAQFLELRQFQRSEIVDIFFNTPLSLMSGTDSTPTYASAEQFSIGFVIYALMPWIVNIEKAIRRDLIPEADRASHYAKFQAQSLMRGSHKEQMEAFASGIDKEIYNPNEVREFLEMNPYEGGDEYRTRTSTTRNTENNDGGEE